MATSADVAALRQIQKDVAALAYREILAFWRTLDPSDPIAAVRALEAFLPEVIAAYGEVGAAAAADFYDELRSQSPAARQAYAAVMGDAVPLDQVRASTRWAAGPLFVSRPDFAEATLARVIEVADRFVKAQPRRTIVENVRRDPAGARYARVPSGATTCGFCLTLASRGAVYATEASAGEHYHGHCDCVPTPVWTDSDLPEGYDLEALQRTYRDAKRQTDGGSLKEVTSVLDANRPR